MSSLRIAAAQSVSVPGDIAANVAAHCNFIVEASACDVDIVVFPELSLCGYELSLIGACALHPHDEVLAPIRELASGKAISVVVGAPILFASNNIHIGAITFLPNGEASIYCKQHLHPGEERFASACASPCSTYLVGGETIALAICADTAHEQHPQAAAAVGASLYLASVLVSDAGYATDAGNLQRYAECYCMATLMANHGGTTGGYVSAGKSAFWSQEGNLVVVAPSAGQYLVIASKSSEGWAGELRKIET
ncbi:MAG: carbon-nitrogen hydrolase family protein [Glaciimonas sp.]|nr:carbon-nitrogen hydrolase family protein [Glaciimonas sp.]